MSITILEDFFYYPSMQYYFLFASKDVLLVSKPFRNVYSISTTINKSASQNFREEISSAVNDLECHP